MPITAHAAFEKVFINIMIYQNRLSKSPVISCTLLFLLCQAAQLMDCRIRYVPVDEHTRAVTVRAMRRAITKNTCLVRTCSYLMPDAANPSDL